jgi:hypothetical protein
VERCEQIRAELPAFVAGEPADDGWESVRSHIGGCAPCADHCASVRKVWGGIGEMAFEEVPAATMDALRARLEQAGAGAHVTGRDWAIGLIDATLGLVALTGLSKVIPVHVICRTCASAVKGTWLAEYPRFAEFVAGSFLSFWALLAALVAMRIAIDRPHARERSLAAGLLFAAMAAFLAPELGVIRGNTVALMMWALGAGIGATLAMTLNRFGPVPQGARA